MLVAALVCAVLAGSSGGVNGSGGSGPSADGRPVTPVRPRELNIVARDDNFSPPAVDLVPGETVLIHVVNGGLQVHEAIIGDQRVQDAWEAAEANAPAVPPGATPAVSVPPALAGVRVVVHSVERVAVVWIVPVASGDVASLIVGVLVPDQYSHDVHMVVQV